MIRRWWRRWWPSWPAIVIVAGLLGVGLVDGVIMLMLHGYGQADRAAPADVIVVLGAGIEPDFRPTGALQRRAEHAVALWRAGYAPYIICSGGYTVFNPLPEASACVDAIVGLGVPRGAVFPEAASRSTEENAIFTSQLMAARGWRSVLVVTDNYHILRSEYLFGLLGVRLAGISPAQITTGPLRLDEYLGSLAREAIALDWQTFKTILGLPNTYVPG